MSKKKKQLEEELARQQALLEEQQLIENSRNVLVHFNGIGNSYFELYLYDAGKLVQQRHVDMGNRDMTLSTTSEQAIADMISKYFKDFSGLYLLLTDRTIRKVTLTYPRIRFTKVEKLYREEIAPEQLEKGDKFASFSECYAHSLGYIYYTYFVPQEIINLFSKAAVLLNCRFGGYNLFSRYIIKRVPHEKKEPLLLYFEEYGNSNMVLAYNDVLSASTTFKTDPEECKKQYFCNICKHFFELEKREARDVTLLNGASVPMFEKYAKSAELSFDTFSAQDFLQ